MPPRNHAAFTLVEVSISTIVLFLIIFSTMRLHRDVQMRQWENEVRGDARNAVARALSALRTDIHRARRISELESGGIILELPDGSTIRYHLADGMFERGGEVLLRDVREGSLQPVGERSVEVRLLLRVSDGAHRRDVHMEAFIASRVMEPAP